MYMLNEQSPDSKYEAIDFDTASDRIKEPLERLNLNKYSNNNYDNLSERKFEIPLENNSFSNKENANLIDRLYDNDIIDNKILNQNKTAIDDLHKFTEKIENNEENVIGNVKRILNESTIEKVVNNENIDAQEDSIIMDINKGIKNYNTINIDSDKSKTHLILKDENQDNNYNNNPENEETPKENLCRICYEGDTEEKGGLIFPCTCTGSCKYIHESCLKTWIENNFSSSKIKAECEICKHPYIMKFYMKNKFSKIKLCSFFKSLAALIVVAGVILALICTVIYVIVTALTNFSIDEQKNFVNILVGIAAGILLIMILVTFRHCKRNFYEPYMCDWRIFNADGTENLNTMKVIEMKVICKNNEENNNFNIQPRIGFINNFRVIEYENSNNDQVEYDIVANNNIDVSPMRYESHPFIRNEDQIVMMD